MKECPKKPLRTYRPENVIITLSPVLTTKFDFITDGESTVKYGTLIIPAGALLNPNDKSTNKDTDTLANNATNKGLKVQEVPESLIRPLITRVRLNATHLADQVYPGLDDYLEYHQTVRSPVVRIDSPEVDDNDSYKFDVVLSLKTDVPDNANRTNDFCLGKADLEKKEWICASKKVISNDNDKYSFTVRQDGIYSVIYFPGDPPLSFDPNNCDWFCRYWKYLVFGTLFTLIALTIIGYFLWRALRYITKYKVQKERNLTLRDEIRELSLQETDIKGQTLGDVMEGLHFTYNPMADVLKTGEHSFAYSFVT